VVPSIYQEPLGLVALEGQAAGCLVVASRVGGLPEIVPTDAGWLVPAGDSEALCSAIQAALQTSSDELARRVAAGREHALGHDVNAAVRRSLDLYHSIRR
jgi:glycosyltransferase involved in cell wall biosynthesis